MRKLLGSILILATLVLTSCGKDSRQLMSEKSQILFSSRRDGKAEIYIMNADGTGQTNLTNNPEWDAWPFWSPDGSKIAFESFRDGNFEIYIMNPDGTELKNLTNNPAGDRIGPWSPDGSKIAFMSDRDGKRTIYVMNADGTAQTKLTDAPVIDFVPAWSPDGRKIAFNRIVPGPGESSHNGDEEIFVMNADGTGIMRLTDSLGVDHAPIWRPHSKK